MTRSSPSGDLIDDDFSGYNIALCLFQILFMCWIFVELWVFLVLDLVILDEFLAYCGCSCRLYGDGCL